MTGLSDNVKYFLRHKGYVAFVTLLAVMAFGYAAVNPSVGIDDLRADVYVGSGGIMLAAGRFGITLWSKIFGYGTTLVENAFVIDVLAVIALWFSAVFFCAVIRQAAGPRLEMAAYMVFSGLYVSYPLMNEIWAYTGGNLCVCVGLLLASVSLPVTYGQIRGTIGKKGYLITIPMMTLVCAGYESVVFVYIFMVFLTLALDVWRREEKTTVKAVVTDGLRFALPLAAGFLLRLVIHRGCLWAFQLTSELSGEARIYWGTAPFTELIVKLIAGIGWKYCMRGLVYFPVAELVIATGMLLAFGTMTAVKTKKPVLLLLFAGMLFSVIGLSLLQGWVSPYRTCQVFAVFVAMAGMVAVNALRGRMSGRGMKVAVLCAAGLLCVWQSMYMNYFMTMNHERSEEEKRVVCTIGSDMERLGIDKPVIFTGTYELSRKITEGISTPPDDPLWKLYSKMFYALLKEEPEARIPTSNVRSVIEWGLLVDDQDALRKVFNHYGFDYDLADYSRRIDEAEAFVKENQVPEYPRDGYIADMGEIVVVNLRHVEKDSGANGRWMSPAAVP